MAHVTNINNLNEALTARYLWHQTNNIPNAHARNILKSYYLIKCRKVEHRKNINLSTKLFKPIVRCPKCCIEYVDGPVSYKLCKGNKQNRFVRRLLKKVNENQNLTRYQDKYVKKQLKHVKYGTKENNFVITCGICKNVVSNKLSKPITQHKLIDTVPTETPKSKKKRKDRFSGLNQESVMSITPRAVQPKYSNNKIVSADTASTTAAVSNKKTKFTKADFINNRKIAKLNKDNKTKLMKNKHNRQNMLKSLLNSSQSKDPSSALKQFLQSVS